MELYLNFDMGVLQGKSIRTALFDRQYFLGMGIPDAMFDSEFMYEYVGRPIYHVLSRSCNFLGGFR